MTIWKYLTPIFYDINILPKKLQFIMHFNPLYIFINSARDIILFAKSPSIIALLACGASAIVALFIGGIVFKKYQDKFIYYA